MARVLLTLFFIGILLCLFPLPKQVVLQLGLQTALLINQLLHLEEFLFKLFFTEVWGSGWLVLGRLGRLYVVRDPADRWLLVW